MSDGFGLRAPTPRMRAIQEKERAEEAVESSSIEVGQTVFSRHQRADGSVPYGLVADMDESGDLLVVTDGTLVVTAHQRGARKNHEHRAGKLATIPVADVDPSQTLPRTDHAIHTAARKALLGAAAGGSGVMSQTEVALACVAVRLLDESGAVAG